MAITKRLKNPPKTQKAVAELIEYTINAEKASDEKALYANSINCSIIGTAEQFKAVRDSWEQNSGNYAYHFVQSFAPGEVTPEEAHQCGMELAKVLFGDLGYQVVVGTHLDREHLHNHFAVNAVNSIDGKKLQTNHEFIRKMRSENDRICREHNLSVITNPKGKDKSYAEWLIEKQGGFTWRGEIRKDIDALIPVVSTFKELLEMLSAQGYTVNLGRKYLSVSPPGTDTNFRLYKLGKGYTEEDIADRILHSRRSLPLQPTKNRTPHRVHHQTARYRGSFFKIKRRGGFRSLYYSYLYRLRKLSKAPVSYQRKMPMNVRHDMKLLNDFAADLTLLSKYSVNDVEQLAKLYLSLKENVKALSNERQDLRIKLSVCSSPEELANINEKIGSITETTKKQRKEIKACERIYERFNKVQKANKQISREEVKNNSKNKNENFAVDGNEIRKE